MIRGRSGTLTIMDDVFPWPIHLIRFQPNVPAGMDPYVLLGMVPILRGSHTQLPPIKLDQPCPTCQTAMSKDGRHRWIGHVMAGRTEVASQWDWT